MRHYLICRGKSGLLAESINVNTIEIISEFTNSRDIFGGASCYETWQEHMQLVKDIDPRSVITNYSWRFFGVV